MEGVTVHAIRGAFSEALAWGAEFIGRSAEWPDMEGTTWLGRVHHNVAYVRRMMKDLPTALVHYKASGAAFRIIGDTPMACYLSVAQAQVQCDLGNLDAAKGLVDGVTESMMPPQRITDLLLVRATYEYLKGNLYPALELAIAALGQSLTRPVGEFQDPLPRALVGHILTKLGHPAEGDIFVAAARDKCARHGRIDLLDQIDRLGGERPWSSELPSSG